MLEGKELEHVSAEKNKGIISVAHYLVVIELIVALSLSLSVVCVAEKSDWKKSHLGKSD